MDAARREGVGRRVLATAAVVLALGALGACGTESPGDDERAPAPIVITASVSGDHVSVFPHSFGAGPINLVVTNQTGAAQQVTLESVPPADGRGGLRQRTAPISPLDTATLAAEVLPGRYTVHVGGRAIAPATLRVGRMRPSA